DQLRSQPSGFGALLRYFSLYLMKKHSVGESKEENERQNRYYEERRVKSAGSGRRPARQRSQFVHRSTPMFLHRICFRPTLSPPGQGYWVRNPPNVEYCNPGKRRNVAVPGKLSKN